MVSVMVLAWNHEKFIEQSLRSVIHQTYRDIEILFLDNNSSDHTFEIAANLLKDSGIKYKAYRRDKNYSISKNLNFLYHASSGKFLCILSGDDWLRRENIERKLAIFEDNPSLGMVDSGGYRFYDDLDIYEPIKVVPVSKENVLMELLQKNYFSGIGCIIKREVIESVGLWDESLIVEDWDMWLRIAGKYEMVRLKEPLFYYRKHIDAISNDPEFIYRAKLQVYDKFQHMNDFKNKTRRNNWEIYTAARVMGKNSFAVTWEILKNFRPRKLYVMLLIKSMAPASWKRRYFIYSLKKKNPIIPID